MTKRTFRLSDLGRGFNLPELAANADARDQRRAFSLFLALFVVAWTTYSIFARNNLDINSDMSENYSWSRELQLGYYKHPPMFAWVVAAWFKIFPTEDGFYYLLSFANVAVGFIGIWMLIGIFDRSPRRMAAMLAMSLLPFYTFSAIKFNANTILLAVWPWLAWATILAVRDRNILHAVLAGALAALSMLSKYVSAVMLLTMFAASFTVPGWQAFYRSRALVAMLLAFAVAIAPHLVWLHMTGYTTFKYVDSNRADSFGRFISGVVNFIAAQALWMSALFGALFLTVQHFGDGVRSVLTWREANSNQRLWLLMLFGPIVLTLILAAATSTRLSAPWGIPLWFAIGAVLLYAPEIADADIDIRTLTRIVMSVLLAIIVIAPLIRLIDYAQSNAKALEPRREVATFLSELWHKRTGKPLINVAGSQAYASAVTFYAPDHPSEFVEFETNYAPWMTAERLKRGGLAIVCAADDTVCFEAAKRFTEPSAERITITMAQSYLGFRGPPATLTLILQRPKS